MNYNLDLSNIAKSVKRRFLKMYFDAKAGHVGSSLSCAEILTFLKFSWMKDGDELVLSKGHAAAALYSVWAEAGILSDDEINTFYKNGTYLSAHPPVNKIKSIPFATGSLGHGLSLASGLAFSSKLKKDERTIFCVTSDGEINEGSTWEAALFIIGQNLKNLVWVIDRNRLQGFGFTEKIMPLEPLADKLSAFGFDVIKINGHQFEEFSHAKAFFQESSKPVVIIAETQKGNGWEDMQDTLECHYLPMTSAQYETMLAKLDV
jgi:transketolase